MGRARAWPCGGHAAVPQTKGATSGQDLQADHRYPGDQLGVHHVDPARDGAPYRHLLTVRGRKTGQLRTTPVDVMEAGGQRWLVAGYGPANWVRNARAAGEITLSRGGRQARYEIAEPAPGEAVPVLRKYMNEIRVTRPYFDATPASADSEIEAELPRHPVLRLIPKP